MRFRSGLAALCLLFLFACNSVRVVPYEQVGALQAEQTVRFFYPSARGNIEAYVARPRGVGGEGWQAFNAPGIRPAFE